MRVAIFGGTGRMGGAITRAAGELNDVDISGALTGPDDPLVGVDLGVPANLPTTGITVTADAAEAVDGADVVIDFTLPSALQSNLAACVKSGTAMVIGTTGLSDGQLELLNEAAQDIPIVYGRNMSVGVNVFTELARIATRYLGADWDVEIFEAHHRFKVDAPSGTALQLGEAVANERGQKLDDVAAHNRSGKSDAREKGEIGFTSMRAGNIVGDHSIVFAADTEIVELKHHAQDRSVFAHGALRAARWVNGKPAGLYSMADVLGFEK